MLIGSKHKRASSRLGLKAALTLGLSAQLGFLAGCGSEGGSEARAAARPVEPAAIVQAGNRPRAVQASIDEATRLCRAEGGQITPEADFDTRLDLNGDGVPDHIIDFRNLACDGASDDYFGPARNAATDCGPVGCRAQIFLSSSNGHVVAFNEQVWTIEIDRAAQPPRLKISTHGGPECQASAAEGCHAYWAWSGGAFVRTGWAPGVETQRDTGPAPSSAGFTVNVSLSSQAAARLRGRESIIVSAYFYGPPKPGREDDTDDLGDIDLGAEEARGEGRAGSIRVSGQNFRSERLDWIAGRPRVNVNIFTSRSSNPDNLIYCEPHLEGDLADIAGRTHEVRCALISEG